MMICISANEEICREISRDLNFIETAMINDFTVSANAKVNLDISWSNSKLIAEKTVIEKDKVRIEFDGIWESSLTDSTSKGKPDTELVDFTSRFSIS